MGCLLGGAVGDALGAPVEFMGYDEIVENFGPCGIMEYVPYGGRKAGAITDDTQMTLFTAEGLLLGHSQIADGQSNIPAALSRAYLRWLKTQGVQPAIQNATEEGWLFGIKELHHIRAPGKTCIKELKALQSSTTGEKADNDKKGCGGVMRVAPVGIFGHDWLNEPDGEKRIFELGCQAAWITHGHPTGYLAAGAFSLIVAHLMVGVSLPCAISCTAKILEGYDRHEEVTAAIQAAMSLAHKQPCSRTALPLLGEGWVAEEALAIGIYCALSAHSFDQGICLAVNHQGDSDSTGSIAGNLLGTMMGVEAIDCCKWLNALEAREGIEQTATYLIAPPSTVRQ